MSKKLLLIGTAVVVVAVVGVDSPAAALDGSTAGACCGVLISMCASPTGGGDGVIGLSDPSGAANPVIESPIVLPAQQRWDVELEEAQERQSERQDPNEAAKPWLGVRVQALDDALREAFDLNGPGVLINRVVEGSPAADAGLRTGDIMTHVDGRPVRTTEELRRHIRQSGPGELDIEYIRRGRERQTTVELRLRREARAERRPRLEVRRFRVHADGGYLGVALESLNPDLAYYFDVEPASGVLVTRIIDDSPAYEAGLQSGDVIQMVDGEPITSPGELRDRIQSHDSGDEVTITAVRRGRTREIEVVLGRRPGVQGSLDLHSGRPLPPHGGDWHKFGDDLARGFDDLRQRLDEEPIRLESRLEQLEKMLERLQDEVAELRAGLDR